MPSSRKRAKGKERKAKALVPKQREWEVLARWGQNNLAIQCTHGCLHVGGKLLIPQGPVRSFLNAVDAFDMGSGSWYEGMESLFKQYHNVCNDKGHREVAKSILLAIGINSILIGDDIETIPNTYAIVSLVLEHYRGDFEYAFWTEKPY